MVLTVRNRAALCPHPRPFSQREKGDPIPRGDVRWKGTPWWICSVTKSSAEVHYLSMFGWEVGRQTVGYGPTYQPASVRCERIRRAGRAGRIKANAPWRGDETAGADSSECLSIPCAIADSQRSAPRAQRFYQRLL